MRWFWPSWSGDWRLESVADHPNRCTLTIVAPTPAEVELLGRFLQKARSKGWVAPHIGFNTDGEVKIDVDAPLAKAGRILLGKKPRGVLTAVKSVAGAITAYDDAGKAEEAAGGKDAAAATSVKRPTLCCPVPVPGPDVRANEVLEAFCTRRQWAEWQAEGLLHCTGSLSGRRYEIAHRHHPAAIQRRKVIWDAEGQYVLHAHATNLPPPEEVLVMKLVLEHREAWIRNPSGIFAMHEPVYDHPFMDDREQYRDGLAAASIMRSLGTILTMFAPGKKPRA